MNDQKRISEITQAVRRWLKDDSGNLAKAVDQSVEEEGYSRSDIFHRLQEVERTVTEKALSQWIENLRNENHIQYFENTDLPTILCLHAGNLPLVGLQDIIAVLLSGYHYLGKVSGKDRCLTESLLHELRESDLKNRIAWEVRLSQIKGERVRGVMFSGSEDTVPKVWQMLHEIKCECPPENRLVRTASHSVAWMERCSDKDLYNLAEAILRYDGKGCRSVKLIVSPLPLEEVAPRLREAISHFRNSASDEISQSIQREAAFAKATGKTAIPAGPVILRSEQEFVPEEHVVPWIKGNSNDLKAYLGDNLNKVQNCYVEDAQIVMDEFPQDKTDLLSRAQTPEINWKPDGTDPLKWLQEIN